LSRFRLSFVESQLSPTLSNNCRDKPCYESLVMILSTVRSLYKLAKKSNWTACCGRTCSTRWTLKIFIRQIMEA